MKIDNRTRWETKPIRDVFLRCLAEVRRREGKRFELSRQNITLLTHKSRGWIGGCAAYHSRYLTIKIPLDASNIKPSKLADTYLHEVGHNLGVRHNKQGDTMEGLYAEWIEKEFANWPSCFLEKTAKPKPNPIESRYQRAIKNLNLAKTRLRRATTIFRKWKKAITYYEGKYAFAKPKQ